MVSVLQGSGRDDQGRQTFRFGVEVLLCLSESGRRSETAAFREMQQVRDEIDNLALLRTTRPIEPDVGFQGGLCEFSSRRKAVHSSLPE